MIASPLRQSSLTFESLSGNVHPNINESHAVLVH
jgi:hypothetical protein